MKVSCIAYSTMLSIYIYLPACLPACLPARPPACPPACLPACLPACPPAVLHLVAGMRMNIYPPLHSQFPASSRQQRQLRANTFTVCGVYCLYVAVAVFLELLTFVQYMLIEMDVTPQSITVKCKRGVGGRRAGDCKHFFKLCVISGFRSDRNGIWVLQGCNVAYSQAQELDPWRWDRKVVPKRPVHNYRHTLRNIPEARRSLDISRFC